MDALAAIVTLLKPKLIGTKIIQGKGRWGVRYPAFGQPSFALMLKGNCLLSPEGASTMILESGDFVLFPSMPGFTLRSDRDAKPRQAEPRPSAEAIEEITHGKKRGEPAVKMLGGYFAFDPVNAPLLLGYLPPMLRLRSATSSGDSVASVIHLIRQEVQSEREGRTFILTRLLEVILIEALRSAPIDIHSAGLLTGLRHPRIAAALRGIHGSPNHPWTLATLAREAGMSRSSFAEYFARLVGLTPLNYLLRWRLSVAGHLLVHEGKSVTEAALKVGYESASGFSTAFSRETGLSPKEFTILHRRRSDIGVIGA